ncbi:Thiol-disulfide oxidoreductase ResA [Bremerella volcania]|uniref:Thiol-disulfide oxidoreductase ResA n=1 Tax=Bremerella volcania TaxID=2527984 RepID=A0A518C2I3_9BACT|nr:TlpA disulfide reductase family protein [Bremerella volcania]QDU73423.1 Thiol-disulfide oxidoreductase ResA [Bremerella volcania]
MKRAWTCCGISLLWLGLAVPGIPLFAEDASVVESSPSVETAFEPKTADEGFHQFETFMRDPNNPLPIAERLTRGIAMLDTLWGIDSDVEFKRKLIWTRFSLRMGQARTGNEMSIETLLSELNAYSQHEEPKVALTAKDARMTLELMLVREKSDQERLTLVQNMQEEIEAMDVSPASAKLAMTLARNLSTVVDDKSAARIADELSLHFAKSDDAELQHVSEDLKGFSRMINLNGHQMRIAGKTLEGKELAWESLRGKIVLVDFWATWCGPCVAEFPQLKQLYKAYHEHGFEVVGISLDDAKADVQQFVTDRELPWIIVCNAEGDDYNGFSDANARYYGINAIPQMIFVGKDGIVQATDARGEKLALLLAQAFPDVEAPELESEEPAAEQE